MKPTQQRRPTHQRRVEIADAALRVIAEQGIAAFTMDRLSREVGMTSGALFRHFASKEEILRTAVDRAIDLLRQAFPPASLPPLERLQAFVRARTALVGSNQGLAQLVFSEQFMKALDDTSREHMQQVMRASQEYLLQALSEAQAKGQIRRDVPPDGLAQLVMGTILATLFVQRGAPATTEPWQALKTLLAPS